MTYRVVRTEGHEIDVRYDDDDALLRFEIDKTASPPIIMRAGQSLPGGIRLASIDDALRVAEGEAKRLGRL